MQQRRTVRLHFILNLIIAMLIMLACTSFAWFTDKASVDNVVLNFGKIELDVGEAGTKTGMKLVVAREDGSDGDSTMMPGDTVTVKMSVKLKDDSQPAYYLIWLNDNDLFNCDKYLFFSSNGNTYATDGTTTNQVNANGTLGTNTISSIVGKISRNQIHNIEFTLNMELNLSSQSSSNTVYAAKTDSTLSETEVYDSKNLTCKIYAIQQANITEPEAFAELSQEAVKEEGKSATFVKGAVSLSGYTTVGFYKTSGLPSTVSLNSSLTSTYDAAVTNTAEKGMIKVYTSSDNTEIAFACDYKIMAPADCSTLFQYLKATTINFNNFNTCNVTNMNSMFAGCYNLTSLDLSGFNTSNVTDMGNMFGEYDDAVHNTSLVSLNLSSFDTSNVTDMSSMFYYCSALTELDLSNFDTSKVTDMSCMFKYCSALTSLDVSSFDTSKVTNMMEMFLVSSSLTELDLSSFSLEAISSSLNIRRMLHFISNALTKIVLPSTWGTYNPDIYLSKDLYLIEGSTSTKVVTADTGVELTSTYAGKTLEVLPTIFPTTWKDEISSATYMTTTINKLSLTQIDFETTAPTGYTNIGKLSTGIEVYQNTSSTGKIAFVSANTIYAPVDSSYLLSAYITPTDRSSYIYAINFNNFNTRYVTNMSGMFAGQNCLTSLDLSGFNTSKVTDMSYMFAGYDEGSGTTLVRYCDKLKELNLTGWDTSNVTNMSYMFSSCGALTELDLSHFDTSKVTNMSYMFYGSSSSYGDMNLTMLDLSGWNTSRVETWNNMFGNTFTNNPSGSELIISSSFVIDGVTATASTLSSKTNFNTNVTLTIK